MQRYRFSNNFFSVCTLSGPRLMKAARQINSSFESFGLIYGISKAHLIKFRLRSFKAELYFQSFKLCLHLLANIKACLTLGQLFLYAVDSVCSCRTQRTRTSYSLITCRLVLHDVRLSTNRIRNALWRFITQGGLSMGNWIFLKCRDSFRKCGHT